MGRNVRIAEIAFDINILCWDKKPKLGQLQSLAQIL